MKKCVYFFGLVLLAFILSASLAVHAIADGGMLLAQAQKSKMQPITPQVQKVALEPAVQSLTINPTSVSVGTAVPHSGHVAGSSGSGASALGTITLSAPAGSSGTIVNLSSSNPGATVPANITLPAGSQSIAFAITVAATAQPGSVIIKAVSSGNSGVAKEATLTVLGTADVGGVIYVIGGPNDDPCCDGFNANIMPGYVCSAKVLLNSQLAPPGGLKVNFSSSSASVIPDNSVIVPEGTVSALFHFKVASTASPGQQVTITAVRDGSGGVPKTMAVDIKALQILKLRMAPTVVDQGGTSIGTVSFGNAVPKAGSVNVSLTSSSSSVTVPASLTIPGGAYNATFTATVRPTATKGEAVMIGASMGNISVQPVIVQVKGAQVKDIYLPPLYAANQVQARVDLDVTAGLPVKVNLSSSSPDVTVPASVTVAQGQYSIWFTLSIRQSAAVGSTITISATRDGTGNTTQQTTSKVELVRVRSIFAPSPIKVGQTVTGTVVLDGNVEPGGAVVILTAYEDQPGMGTMKPQTNGSLQIPASVTVAAGQTSVTFSVTGKSYGGSNMYIGGKRSGTATEQFTNLLTTSQ